MLCSEIHNHIVVAVLPRAQLWTEHASSLEWSRILVFARPEMFTWEQVAPLQIF